MVVWVWLLRWLYVYVVIDVVVYGCVFVKVVVYMCGFVFVVVNSD